MKKQKTAEKDLFECAYIFLLLNIFMCVEIWSPFASSSLERRSFFLQQFATRGISIKIHVMHYFLNSFSFVCNYNTNFSDNIYNFEHLISLILFQRPCTWIYIYLLFFIYNICKQLFLGLIHCHDDGVTTEREKFMTHFFLLLFSVRIINTKYNNNEVIDRRKKKFSGLLFIVCLKHSTLVLVLKTFSHFNWNYMLNAYFFSLSLFFHVLQFSRWSTTVGANVWKQQQQGTPHRREQRIHEKNGEIAIFFIANYYYNITRSFFWLSGN